MNDDEPVLTSKEFLSYRRASGALPEFPAPHTVIFALQKSLADHVLRKHSGKQIKGFHGELYLLKSTKGQVALSTGLGIGAPVIASLTDEFAALGVKQFALIGIAGGLQPSLKTGSLVLSMGAIRGEGVSRHYLPPAHTVQSSPEMIGGVSEILTKQNHQYALGLTWTTDAPFRELRKDVLAQQNNGVLAVDMEAAAMLSVAEAYNLPALAAFSIADTLANGTWNMSRDLRQSRDGLFILFDAVFQYLRS